MKKLYRKGTVHPSPPIISDHLSFLPAAILTLAAALSPEDREVLAYLISCSNASSNNYGPGHRGRPNQKIASSCGKSSVSNSNDHPPLFNCDCFRCYMSYWVRWDSSPNRQLIHEIIDAYEDGLSTQSKGNKIKKERKKRGNNNRSGELNRTELSSGKDDLGGSDSVDDSNSNSNSRGRETGDGVGEAEGEGGGGGEEKGSVRRIVSFIGERIWGAWGQ